MKTLITSHRSLLTILRSRSAFIPIALALGAFALSPRVQAVIPPPDGGYAGGNTAEGQNALLNLTTGGFNTAAGFLSLRSNTTGAFNTAIGAGTLLANTADNNTAISAGALLSNTTGSNNTANGTFALFRNTTGAFNNALGANSLFSNVDGSSNNALGESALFNNISGSANTAIGDQALTNNTTGNFNTATGSGALFGNTTGNSNTANGIDALASNTTGDSNTANGTSALEFNDTGSGNTATGVGALFGNTTGNYNTATGSGALFSNTESENNTAIGNNAGRNLTTGDNNIDIGNSANAAEANTIRIGVQGTQTATFIAGISGATVTGTAVVVDGSGQLGVAPSSARFKEAIKSMDNASEALFSLKPVTFRYKKEIDPARTSQFGLVAEEVEKVNRDLVVRDKDGKTYTVRYDAVNAMLLNEFLKEHRTVQELKSVVAKQETAAAQQQKQIAALTAGLQKVSAQVEVSKPLPQMVVNNQ